MPNINNNTNIEHIAPILASVLFVDFYVVEQECYLILILRRLLLLARRSAQLDLCRRAVSVCLSHAGIVSKRINLSENVFDHLVASSSSFSTPKIVRKL